MTTNELSPEEVRDSKIYIEWGLTEQEYDLIVKELKRLPNFTETGIFSGMWSEHVSYKKSKPILRKFWSTNERVLQGPGEGAGILDIGDNQAVVFKAESHNHPSFVEPYEGAATGVGGILRDIFSMGAQPIAVLDSLRFGELDNAHTKHIVDGVIAGIAGYGNAIGIPTVGGEIGFDGVYAGNPLVNVMAVGLMDQNAMQVGQAKGIGNSIIYVGAKTGRDGINGASFASAEFSSEEKSDRSAVQVGDPFLEKLVMDATLQAVREHSDIIVGIQDMGAAGLLSSSSEMAAKAGMGINLNLDMVPQRETGMTPYELMLSESQERMVLVVKKGEEQAIIDLFQSADLDAVIIGQVTDDGRYRLNFKNEVVADVPVDFLTHAPKQDLPMAEPARLANLSNDQFEPDMGNVKETILTLLAQPTIASKASLFRHFDSQVRADTAIKPGGDAALIRIRDTQKALAMTTDVNARYLYLNPRVGAKMAVAEAARNIVSTGSKPIGITDGLNFGSPDNPEVYYELDQAVAGINDVAKQLDTPIISGNVSLYNETDGQAIYPTPMIGMVGLLEDITKATRIAFQSAGDSIYLVGRTKDSFNGSEIQKMQTGHIAGQLFDFNDEDELAAQQFILDVTDQRLLNSAHDLSEGGLVVGLLESAFAGNLSFDISVDLADKYLFSETPSRFVVSVSPENRTTFESLAGDRVTKLGVVTADDTINITTTTSDIQLSFSETKKIYQESIAWKLNAE
ncbi:MULTISPECIES: phosphoribosylformylglycinamidine synthase subunit PurL [Leuconostoc]|uniref:Phosphoribosylformylglycinamidine synthase subunit PurL n=1 Tax=Leuconostoc suionicum TaxID=1511761 RepID=A0A2N9K940_9LACO|nr:MULTISPECIES: phosphoribosylformylglycinamidine synthase subunit PurL [Leuconostoc]API71787.1 phosphoribosylformylglycinamidine synthase II [Leuconostoc suionicum]MBE4727034.1 phosphoribosylformylglycinamidine synthase subunit PurL [Leuconostoc suionicum]MCT4402587.1 phosphoribosylformylglycinamidine synthase subunit PurL [Leuconostoc suionicum]MDI6497041.1 phosphoribosylformylglycinamidine synthase subunit PurL [Leuconostoc suionicum]MDI6499168.1 phosphoribosylformylglycinamidine synthase 